MDLTAISYFLLNCKRIGFTTAKSESKSVFFVVWRTPDNKYFMRKRGPNIKSNPTKITYEEALIMIKNGNNQQMLKNRRDW